MKKMNKKGSTLLELVISIALISVILVFLTRLLIDLNNTETNNVYAVSNQINRAEILRMIENDLNNNTISNINSSNSTNDKLIIEFSFKNDKTSIITATKDKLTYKSSSDETRTWTMKNAKIYTKQANVQYLNDEEIYTLQIDIEVHTQNEKNMFGNNNIIDDILISYIGKKVDFNKNITCLGNDC